MPRGPLSRSVPKKKEKKPKIPKEERVKRVKKAPHPDNIAPDRKLFGTKTAHAKWPAMFKRHLGVIETHSKFLVLFLFSFCAWFCVLGIRMLWT